MVEIDNADTGGNVVAAPIGAQFVRLLKKTPAVHQSGQLVDPCKPVEPVEQNRPFRLDFLALANIAHEGRKPAVPAVGLDLERLELDRDRLAVLMEDVKFPDAAEHPGLLAAIEIPLDLPGMVLGDLGGGAG